jgi:hypothetical protein
VEHDTIKFVVEEITFRLSGRIEIAHGGIGFLVARLKNAYAHKRMGRV